MGASLTTIRGPIRSTGLSTTCLSTTGLSTGHAAAQTTALAQPGAQSAALASTHASTHATATGHTTALAQPGAKSAPLAAAHTSTAATLTKPGTKPASHATGTATCLAAALATLTQPRAKSASLTSSLATTHAATHPAARRAGLATRRRTGRSVTCRFGRLRCGGCRSLCFGIVRSGECTGSFSHAAEFVQGFPAFVALGFGHSLCSISSLPCLRRALFIASYLGQLFGEGACLSGGPSSCSDVAGPVGGRHVGWLRGCSSRWRQRFAGGGHSPRYPHPGLHWPALSGLSWCHWG